jgi:predicted RNA binding protein YcfA (HicA-like mRNA interferase family)
MAKKKGNTLKIVPIKATKLEKIFIKLGFQSRPGKGSHIVITNEGLLFPITFGNHPTTELSKQTIKALIKNAKISTQQYLDAFNSL